MPKATKKRVCTQCDQEKLVAEGFNKNAKRCKICNRTGEQRQCGSCGVSEASCFAAGKRNCKQCNSHPDTAERVDVCQGEGCDQPFTTERFEWRGTMWRSKCRTCTNKKSEVPEDAPDRICSACDHLKPAKGFHGLKCHDCKLMDDRTRTAQHGQERTIETAPRPERCSRSDCGTLFTPEAFRYSASEGRWKSECVQCNNESRYWKAYKERRMLDDPVGYQEHTAAVSAVWRTRARATLGPAWKAFKVQAGQRGVPVVAEEEEDLKFKLLEPCNYCGYLPPEGSPLNSLDRVDNDIRLYTLANVVTCCTPCNRLKGTSSVTRFLEEAAKEASSTNSTRDVSRQAISEAHRSLGNHDGSRRAKELYIPEQWRFVALHNKLEF